MDDLSEQSLSELRHAVRNKLNTISINAELIRLQLDQGKPTEMVLQSLERILAECKSCDGLVD